MLLHDLLLLAWSYLVLLSLQFLALPAIFFVSKKFSYIGDAFWGFARIFSLLFLSLTIWFLAFLKIPVNTDFGVSFILLILLLLSCFLSSKFFLKDKKFLIDFFKRFGKIILIEEIVFLAALVFLFITRSFQPEILGLEKFMDAGFIQAYLKSPTLPVEDIWFAGSSINYYSFGHFYNAILLHLWRMDLAYGYNFLLIALFGIFALELFSIGFNLHLNLFKKSKNKAAIVAGLLTVFLVALGANGHTLWYFFKNGNFSAYWYPDATRFIDRTIHEFPAYSFVVCDLHAHVLSLPISLLMVLSIFVWLEELLTHKKLPKIPVILIGILFGILVMTNTWDIMIYGLLLVIISSILLSINHDYFKRLFVSAAVILTMTAMTSSLWFLNFSAISNGVLLAKEHTPFWQLLVLWGPHLFWATLLIFNIRKLVMRANSSVSILFLSLFFLILFLIIFPELFYFKDIYTTYPRANTMFKLVFQAFMLLGILVASFFTMVFFKQNEKNNKFFYWRMIDLRHLFRSKKDKLFKLKVKLRRLILVYLPITAFLAISCLAYPYYAYTNYYGGLRKYQGLDGLAWFSRKYPEDFVLLNYLKDNEPKQVNIVEAVGESYTEFARMSSFSGMPTILGWRVHEWLWRAGWTQPGIRTREVEEIYNSPLNGSSLSNLKKYNIKYIVVGSKEWEAYPRLKLKELLSLGEVAVSVGNHYLIKLY